MPKTKYNDFTSDDFASDDYFIDWCLGQNAADDMFWEDWTKNHPQKKSLINRASRTVQLLHQAEKKNVNAAMKKEIWDNLSLHMNRGNELKEKPRSRSFNSRTLVGMAASLLFLFAMYFMFNTSSRQIEWTQHANLTNQTESVILSDGTKIALQPNSSIEYNDLFGDQKREIILKGEAFFDVARDTSTPFFVYANKTITRVLGTSFLVRAVEGLMSVEVEVTSGEVAVFANVSNEKENKTFPLIFKKDGVEIPKPNYKVNLLPNEKISFDIEKKDIIKSIVESPKLVTDVSELLKVEFKDDPVTEVFKTLEEAYGINIEYENTELDKCSISTKLDDSPLFTKLDMICAALELSYEEKDAVIYVFGGDCGI